MTTNFDWTGPVPGFAASRQNSFPDASALDAAHAVAARLGQQQAAQMPQFIEPDIVQPPQMDEQSIKMQTIAEVLSALGALSGGQQTVAPIGTARAGQRAAQGDVAKQRQQIENAKAEFDMRLATQAYAHNVERKDRLADDEETRQANLMMLQKEMDAKLAQSIKESGVDPVAGEGIKSLVTFALGGADVTEATMRSYLANLIKTDGKPADDPKTLGLARTQVALAASMRATQYKETKAKYENTLDVARIRSASSEKSERDRIARIETQRKLINDQRAPLASQLDKIALDIRQAVGQNLVWKKAIAAYGLDPGKPEEWENSPALQAARPWLAPNNDALIAAVGKADLGEALKLGAFIDRKEAERAAIQKNLDGYQSRLNALELQLAVPSAPAADPMIDPVDGMTEEQRAALLKALGL